jgi:hypothetical protein
MGPLYTVSGNINWYVMMEKSMAFSQIFKNRSTVWSSNPTTSKNPKEIKVSISKRHLHSHAHCSIIHNVLSEDGNNVGVHQLMNENMVHTHNWILSSHKKQNEIPSFPKTWRELQITMSRETNQTHNYKYPMTLLICEIYNVDFCETGTTVVVTRGQGEMRKGWSVGTKL